MHSVSKAADRSVAGPPARFTLALLGIANLVLVGCGGTTAPTGGDGLPPSPPPLLFAAIAGEWAGPGSDLQGFPPLAYHLDIVLQAEAHQDDLVGTIAYSGMITCGGNLMALEAGGSEYAVREKIVVGLGKPECADGGTIRLKHDAASDVLSWEWWVPNGPLIATAVLTRKE